MNRHAPTGEAPPLLRRFPYPYRTLLAICSDLDRTADADAYLSALRFLTTTAETSIGRGVGLEVGNTIYFDMPPGQFSYWGTDDRGRAMVRALIRSGHVDCLHSFGDLTTTRAQAGRALDELVRHDCRLAVWIDHAVAPSNFGADRMAGSGDVAGSPVFHADLTCGYGIEYVWRGRVTSITGQNASRSLAGIYHAARPAASLKTLAKEWAKGLAGRAGSVKYRMHARNDVLWRTTLRSGHRVTEFLRANPHWGGVSCCDTADGLAEVLTPQFLDRLQARQAVCVLYTHLGKTTDRSRPFSPATCGALRLLSARAAAGLVMVTTTRRLLDYCRLTASSGVTASDGGDVRWIDVSAAAGSEAAPRLEGLTFYTDDASRCRVRIDGRERTDIVRNPPDETGRASISIPWTPIEFPSL